MMILTGSRDESTIIVLDDGSEIEIKIIEFEGTRSKVVIGSGEHISVVHEILNNANHD